MIGYNIADIESAERLAVFCRKFDEDVNVNYGRLTVDGKSLLGILSVSGNHVSVEILTENEEIKKRFENGILKL